MMEHVGDGDDLYSSDAARTHLYHECPPYQTARVFGGGVIKGAPSGRGRGKRLGLWNCQRALKG